MTKRHYTYPLTSHGDERGSLVAFEEQKNLPFDVKRAFYIFDTKCDAHRGCHANKNSQFVLVVISGSCRIRLDDGVTRSDILLNKPNLALFLDNMVWKEMYEFSYNAVLLVFSSHKYDETEYVRTHEEFLRLVRQDL